MKTLSTILFLAISLALFSQKPVKPSSCYQLKSKMGSFSSSSQNDDRDDFIDILNYSINLDITDFAGKTIAGYTKIRFEPKQTNQTSMILDLLILDVDSVSFTDNYGTNLVSYNYNDTTIDINFPYALTVGQTYRVKVYYQGAPIQISGDWGGFFWNATYAYNIGVSFTEEIHNFGKAWFPCFDNFTERSTYDFAITTQANHKAFCNGVLQSESTNLDGTKTWRWQLDQKIPTYLANVAVANYATVYDSYSSTNSIPIELAALASDTTNLKNSFIHLKDAMTSFESRFGAYRFDRIGYCLTSFSAGAMEHATNITYMKAVANGTTTYETLMAHELSHHWFGNNTTCATAEDMWLNEGWASYAEAIFTESVYGYEAYKDYNRKNHDDVLRRTHIRDGEYLPVSGVPSHHTYSSTVYDKGADMVSTIRGILGDDIFFDAITEFQEIYKFSDISTDVLNTYLSNYSGLNLTSFFETWVKQKGFHHFSISDMEIVENNGTFLAQGSIKQKLWEASQYTDFLPIEITFFDNNWNRHSEIIYIYGECSEFEFDLNFEPIFWALDLEEKIQDATVDKFKTINSTGVKDFGLARVRLTVNTENDSSFVRCTHHYINPDPKDDKTTNFHLSPNRYWSIKGIFSESFNAKAQLKFDGTTSNSTGYLDNDFNFSDENNLSILYRPNTQTEWEEVDSFAVFTQGSSSNKKGYIEVYNIKKGDYVLAVNDASQTQDTETKTDCIFTEINNVERLKKLIEIYPVPTNHYININFLAPINSIKKIIVSNVLGKEVKAINTTDNNKTIKFSTKNWAKGNYLISFIDTNDKKVFTRKIIVK